MDLSGLRVAYAPYNERFDAPGDRRRFCRYAAERGIEYELADPGREYDVVVLSARADITRWARYRPGRAKLVYDLVDAYLRVPRWEIRSMLRGPAKFVTRENRRLALNYRRAMEEMCRRADAVVCTAEGQRRDMLPLCPNVHVILDSHAEVVRRVKTDYSAGEPFNVVWEGLHDTVGFFDQIADVLRELGRRHPIAFHLVTQLEFYEYTGRFVRRQTSKIVDRYLEGAYLYQWNQQMLAPIATACDLALLPLRADDPFIAGKSDNKLILFWKMGVPAITSATPAYVEAMRGAGLDMACAGPEDWARTIEQAIENEELRREAGTRGREYAEREHGEERLLERWDAVFESVLAEGSPAAGAPAARA